MPPFDTGGSDLRTIAVTPPIASFLYVNVTAPMPPIDVGHVGVLSFRGLDRRTVPGWCLLAMRRSVLFTRRVIRTATVMVWF